MQFSALLSIELQLICHACDLPSILSLALRSRSTLASASSEFAFQFCLPLSVCSLQPNLARVLDVSHSWSQPAVSSAEISRVLSIPRLIELDASCRQSITQEIWQEILPHGALRQMTYLCVYAPPVPADTADVAPASLSQRCLALLQLCSKLQMFSQLTHFKIIARNPLALSPPPWCSCQSPGGHSESKQACEVGTSSSAAHRAGAAQP